MKRGNKLIFPGTNFEMEYHAKPEFEHPDDDPEYDYENGPIVAKICEWCNLKIKCEECKESTKVEKRFKDFVSRRGKEEKKNI